MGLFGLTEVCRQGNPGEESFSDLGTGVLGIYEKVESRPLSLGGQGWDWPCRWNGFSLGGMTPPRWGSGLGLHVVLGEQLWPELGSETCRAVSFTAHPTILSSCQNRKTFFLQAAWCGQRGSSWS